MAFHSCLILPLLLLRFVSPAAAQDAATPPGPDVLARLPAAAAIGAVWTRAADPVRFVPADVFRDGARVVYGGPNGARVVLVALLVTDDRVAIRAAWEAATDLYDSYRHGLTADDDFTASLATLAPPAGCVEAKRVEGIDERDAFPTGVTLCAADPDLILLAVASGSLADETGYRAADTVIATALSGSPAQPAAATSPTS